MTDLGILGGGQLARMILQSATSLGLDVCTLEGVADSPAGRLATREIVGAWTDDGALARFAATTKVALLENEFIPATSVQKLEALGVRVAPGSAALATVQDKLWQKERLRDAGLLVPDFRSVGDEHDVVAAGEEWGWPLLLKRRRNGYDGYGNRTLHSPADAAEAMVALQGPEDRPAAERALFVERYVAFERELAVMVARRVGSDEIVTYSVVETVQKNHICHHVYAPAVVSAALADEAARLARAAVTALDLYGVAGVELFLVGDRIVVNEMAPRVHNSGHYTIEACVTSQFENAVRAALNWPLGDPSMVAPAAVMVNLLGATPSPEAVGDGLDQALGVPGAHVHIYGKRESRPGRKMGHVTVVGMDADEARARAVRAADLIKV